MIWPERRATVKVGLLFGAAERTLDGEHDSGAGTASTGGGSGNTFLLVGLERFWTAVPMTGHSL